MLNWFKKIFFSDWGGAEDKQNKNKKNEQAVFVDKVMSRTDLTDEEKTNSSWLLSDVRWLFGRWLRLTKTTPWGSF
ncbi:hypothetical protein [Mycoplasmoides pneumoniae]|uniref:Uncharacterized protein n=2 Tax=Mycoplasmoides pneumoniae TaxID=2104 RepID=A0AAP8E427_MYCPM|nr:hypothetical protein [Mycoplasmoides pneumoniae]ALA29925.1 hypothetical protein C897_00270 [Mycoplasmoides pneumoniae PI 1428]ALA30893.1 hypothetical protein B434_01785 [Mycoplasmoides pneumoniae 19294]ALA32039.1 hypothetical protein F533_00270 [Mycoplasmoides pneumoniae 51494]ALA35562.1 hypothetical protein F539_00265 [Mycoplasmoides pneumoniae FH]ALA36267.1 hypothetical protein F538_00265 [Mycoplasmoides pneumoniae M1139]ALA38386.1 hypothetical protein F529_00265 [Mycoplasmoides pneumoni